jgi:hypothetical protein
MRANARSLPEKTKRRAVKKKAKRSAVARTDSPIGRLSFVKNCRVRRHGRLRNFWYVKPTGDYGKDCATGEKFALEYLKYEETAQPGGLLQVIVQDMPRDQTGIEVAFLATVARAASMARKATAYHNRYLKATKVESSAAA